jgi:hypothetical protein
MIHRDSGTTLKYLPKLNGLVVLHLILVFIIVQFLSSSYRIDIFGFLIYAPGGSGAIEGRSFLNMVFTSILLVVLTMGIATTVKNVLFRIEIDRLDRELMAFVAVFLLAMSGVLSGVYMLKHTAEQSVWMFLFPLYCIFCGLAVAWLGWMYVATGFFDTGYQAHPARLILETGAMGLIVYLFMTRTSLHWSIVQSICMSIASRLDTDVGTLLRVLRPDRKNHTDGKP